MVTCLWITNRDHNKAAAIYHLCWLDGVGFGRQDTLVWSDEARNNLGLLLLHDAAGLFTLEASTQHAGTQH